MGRRGDNGPAVSDWDIWEGSQVSLIAQLVKNPPAMQETPVGFLGRKIHWRRVGYPLRCSWVSLVAQLIKNSPAV